MEPILDSPESLGFVMYGALPFILLGELHVGYHRTVCICPPP